MVKKKFITMITTAAIAAIFGTALAAGGIGLWNDGGRIGELTCETVLAAESSNSSSAARGSDKEVSGNDVTFGDNESGKSEEYRLNDENEGVKNVDNEDDSGGVYDFKDNKTTGTVTVTKEWSDKKTNSERPEPEIKISTKKPSKSTLGYTVTFHGNENNGLAFADGSYVNEILYNSKGEILDGTYKTLDKVGVGWYLDRNYTQKVDVKDDGTVKLKLSEDIELWAKVMTFDVVSGFDFSRIIPNTVTSVIFTDEKMPEAAQLIDNVDIDGDGGVVSWLEDDGEIMKISTQIKGIKTKAGQYCWSMFNYNTNLVHVDLSKLDMSETEYVGYSSYVPPYTVAGSGGMFYGCSTLQSVILPSDMSNVFGFGCMFQDCSSLRSVSLCDSNILKIPKAKCLSGMFKGCSNLEELNFSIEGAYNLSEMNHMFYNCKKLISIDMSRVKSTNNVNAIEAFVHCEKLQSLELPSLTLLKINMNSAYSSLFCYCYSLTALDLTPLNTQNVTNMGYMFYDCSSLTTLDLTPLNTQNVTNMECMFYGCSGLTAFDLTPLDTRNVKNIGGMFENCSNLTTLDLTPLNTQNVTNMGRIFSGCSGLTTLDLTPLDTRNVTYMGNMFSDCSGLTSLDLTPLNTQNVTYMNSMFENCISLTSLDLTPLNTQHAINMESIFANCRGLVNLDLAPLDTTNVVYMEKMFYNCWKLTSLDLTPLNTQSVTNMRSMFDGCRGLITLNLTSFDTQNVTDMDNMFANCQKLTTLNLASLNTHNVTDMSWMFYGCSGLTSLDLMPLDTQNVTRMDDMFRECSSLTSLNLSPLNTQKVTDMSWMFYGCSKLTSLDLTSLDTQNVTNMWNMFSLCKKLTFLDLTSLNTQNVTNMKNMFINCHSLATIKTGATFKFIGTDYYLLGTWRNTAGETFTSGTFPSNVADTYTKISD